MSVITIRGPAANDEAAWRQLWVGYNRFYRADVPEAVTAALWRRILDPAGDIVGLVAVCDGGVIGLAHLILHPSSWSLKLSCYLEDLFVAREARGTGAGRLLIDATVALARESDADRVYWHTQEFNAAARSLYDTVASRTSFVVYRINLA